jgi:hypothetical protein
MLLYAGAGSLGVVGAGCLMAWATNGSWADAALWVTALATVAAFGAAILAAVLVGRTHTLELRREDARLRSERSGQAALVAAWPRRPLGEIIWHSDIAQSIESVAGARVVVRNASQVPVSAVRLDVTISAVEWDPPVTMKIPHRLALLPPTEEEQVWDLDDRDNPISLKSQIPVPVGMVDQIDIAIDFYFTDAAGVRWHRSAHSLREVSYEDLESTL